eukprot:scaffold36300_cov123-Isochrysis_galbana.AAC.3
MSQGQGDQPLEPDMPWAVLARDQEELAGAPREMQLRALRSAPDGRHFAMLDRCGGSAGLTPWRRIFLTRMVAQNTWFARDEYLHPIHKPDEIVHGKCVSDADEDHSVLPHSLACTTSWGARAIRMSWTSYATSMPMPRTCRAFLALPPPPPPLLRPPPNPSWLLLPTLPPMAWPPLPPPLPLPPSSFPPQPSRPDPAPTQKGLQTKRRGGCGTFESYRHQA